MATFEVPAPVPEVVQLARAGDIVGGLPVPGAPQRMQVRAMTPCVLWQLPAPADEAAQLQLSMQLLSQHASRSHEMVMLRTGGPVRRVRHLLRFLAIRIDRAGHTDPAGAADSLPPLSSIASVVGLPSGVVKRAMAQVLGARDTPKPAVRQPAHRALRTPRDLVLAVPLATVQGMAAQPHAMTTH